ncbi:MAG: phosphoribosylaminoimidazolecarboxamide formyltransferase, partial [Schwartzia sp.]|nr:phosphoribosylaminoimidazolecarboxamide formyltransferase [Schwartzia sp. (in: firmicutes)]
FREDVRRPDRDNAIDVYVTGEGDEMFAEGEWQRLFTEKPPVFTAEKKAAWLKKLKDVSLASDAFFPFGDNIERAARSGVAYIAQSGGSIRDDNVIESCDKYGIAMAMTHIRLFHH